MIENVVQGSSSSFFLTKSDLLNFKGTAPRIKAASGNSFCIYSDRLVNVYSAVNVENSLRCQKIFSYICKQSIINVKYTHHLMVLVTTNTLFSFDLDYSEVDRHKLSHILGFGISTYKNELMLLCEKQAYVCECKQQGVVLKSKHQLKKSYSDGNIIDILHASTRTDCYFIFLTVRTVKSEKLVVDQFMKGKDDIDRYEISEVGEPDLFIKSKIYALEDDQFIISLKNEVIAIKKKQKLYIVLDNVSSTSNCEFLLTSSSNLFYLEESTLFGYSINVQKQKIKLHLMDSFIDSKDPLNNAYDGVLLDTIDQRTTLIFSTHSNDATFDMGIRVNAICSINRMNKINDMFNQKASTNELYGFAKRYSFNTLDYLKTKWEASKKQVPDILNLLVYVKDLKFLKSQLAELLNDPEMKYSCSELIKIKERTMQVYATSIIQEGVTEGKIREIMKCILFIRKMNYMNEFEAFKKLGAYEIKQMKSWSFKQYIKLLYCKGYYKRLTYFLTVFKYLFVVQYEQVLNCLMAKLTAGQTINFLKTDQFFLPKNTPFWQSLSGCDPLTPETLLLAISNLFTISVDEDKLQQIRWTISKVMESQWFSQFFFMKHCLVPTNLQELDEDFQYLKQNRAYDCIMKHLYDNFPQLEVMKIYHAIVDLNILPQTYSRKIQLYHVFISILEEAFRQKKVRIQKKTITVRDLLKLRSPSFLYEVIEVLGEQQIYTKIKSMYDSVSKGYFEENFKNYVNFIKQNDYLALIGLLGPFRAMHSSFQMANQEILNCLLKVIFERCTIVSQKQINLAFEQLVHVKVQKKTLAKLDKFVKCSNFCQFFKSFDISSYTFEQFWTEINNLQTDIFQKIIYRYVCQEFLPFKIGEKEFGISTTYNEMLPIIFYLYGQFNFKIPYQNIIRYFITRLIESQFFDTVKTIIETQYLKPLVGSTYIYTRSIIVKILESQYKGGWAIVRRMPFLNQLLDLLKRKDSKHQRAFLNIFQQLEQIVPDINASDLRTRFFQKNSPVFFVRFLLTCIPQNKLSVFPFQTIFKHLGLRRKGTPEEQQDYVMVQLQTGYHYVRCNLYELALNLIDSISLRYEFACYVDELIAYLVCNICEKKIKDYEAAQGFIQMLVDNLGRPQNMMAMIKKAISQKAEQEQNFNDALSILASSKASKNTYFFTQNLDTKYINQLITKLSLESNKYFYLIYLQILSVNPLLATYISIKIHQITLDKLIELSELLAQKSIPVLFNKFMTLCLYLKSLITMSPQVIVNWSYMLVKQRNLNGMDCKVEINLLVAKMGGQRAKILMKYYQQFMETQGQKAEIILGQPMNMKIVNSTSTIQQTKQNVSTQKIPTKGTILVVDRQQIRAQVQQQIREAKALYTKSDAKVSMLMSDSVINTDTKIPNQQPRQHTSLTKLSSILNRKQGIKNSQQFIKKFRQEIAEKFKKTRQSLTKQKSATSIQIEKIQNRIQFRDTFNPKQRIILRATSPENIVISKRSIACKQPLSPQPFTPSKDEVSISPYRSLHRTKQKPQHSILLQRDQIIQSQSPREHTNKQIGNSSLAISEEVISGLTGSKGEPKLQIQYKPQQQKLEMSEKVHEQLISYKQNELLNKISKYKYGYDNQAFAKQILKKIYTQAKQPNCFNNVLRIYFKLCKISLGLSPKAAEIFQKISQINLPFDIRKLFPFDYFFLDLRENAEKLTFKYIKPRLIQQLQKDNLYCISKMCSFALGTLDKNLEQVIYTYYVEKLIKQYVKYPKPDTLAVVMSAIKLSESRIINMTRYLYKILKAIGKKYNFELIKNIVKFMTESKRTGQSYQKCKQYKQKMFELPIFSQQIKQIDQSVIEQLLKIIDTM